MRTKFIQLVIISLVVVACSKDKFTTKPQVEVRSVSPNPVLSGNLITIKAHFTDDEGDLDSVLVIYKWYNGNTVTKADTLGRYGESILQLPKKIREADIFLRYSYNNFNSNTIALSAVPKDTTATFGLILIDKKKNRSDYSESEKISIKKP
ncbi:MAG: hypothetical protein C4308_00910 [Chitinophagaceae bacterium]